MNNLNSEETQDTFYLGLQQMILLNGFYMF